MHDYFQILGVPAGAPADEIRRASRRYLDRSHPDFRHRRGADAVTPRTPGDAAIDFVDMSAIVDRMLSTFFGPDR